LLFLGQGSVNCGSENGQENALEIGKQAVDKKGTEIPQTFGRVSPALLFGWEVSFHGLGDLPDTVLLYLEEWKVGRIVPQSPKSI